MTSIGPETTIARAVSADGSVVVGGDGGLIDAFIWDPINGFRNLQSALTNEFGLDLSGWDLASATGISDDGMTITGWGTHEGVGEEAFIAAIPEPSAAALLFAVKFFFWKRAGRGA